MSLLQMATGVAVAGAVAAGSTAFTAGGLTKTWGGGNTVRQSGWLGGSVDVAVTGTVLTAMTITQAADVATGVNKVTAVALTFDSNTPASAAVTLTSPGATLTAGSTPATATGWFCTAVNGSFQSTCVVGASTTATTDAWYSGVTTFTIGVS